MQTVEREPEESNIDSEADSAIAVSWWNGVTGGEAHVSTPQQICAAIASEDMEERIKPIQDLYSRTLAETGDKDKAKRAVDGLKKRLPAVQWAGVFSKRGDSNCQKESGYMVADLDDVRDIEKTRQRLADDRHVATVFISPTGRGLKVVFQVFGGNWERKWRTLVRYLGDWYACEPDPSGKNPERLCFLSFDPGCKWRSLTLPLPGFSAEELEQLEEHDMAKVNSKAHPKAMARPTPKVVNEDIDINSRVGIAERLLGSIEWQDGVTGYLPCPNNAEHTTGDGERDCRITLDGVPTVYCFHAHCQPGTAAKPGRLDEINHKLRSEIAKAEHAAKSKRPAAGAEDDDILKLAGMEPADYDRVRADYAEKLRVRRTTLDDLVRTECERQSQSKSGLLFLEVEPWPERVDVQKEKASSSAALVFQRLRYWGARAGRLGRSSGFGLRRWRQIFLGFLGLVPVAALAARAHGWSR
jgi:hypothetical protein